MNILVIEDNIYKSDKVMVFLRDKFEGVDITLAQSYSSAKKVLTKKVYDFAIIDMTLPSFDRVPGEPAGESRAFGGMDLVKQMQRKKVRIKFLFFTQYKSFAENDKNYTLESIEILTREKYPDDFLGVVYYDNSSVVWKEELMKLMEL